MRGSFGLDAHSLSALAAALQTEARVRRQRSWMSLAAPLLGFAPAELQQRWERGQGFPAQAATTLSALIEMAVGGVGIVQLILLLLSAQWFLPGGLRWLAFLGPVLVPEGILRLHHVNAHGEPIGSFLGVVPLLPFGPRRRTPPRPAHGRGPLASVLWTAAVTVAVFFAPRRHQVTWGKRIGLWAPLLTLLSATCEIVGGAVDVTRDGAGAGVLTLVSLLVLADGLARLLLAVLSRGPVGSIFGLPFLRLYDGWIGSQPSPPSVTTARK